VPIKKNFKLGPAYSVGYTAKWQPISQSLHLPFLHHSDRPSTPRVMQQLRSWELPTNKGSPHTHPPTTHHPTRQTHTCKKKDAEKWKRQRSRL